MLTQSLGFLVLWAVCGALVGAAIGHRRGRPGLGGAWGAMLGPLGWWIVARGNLLPAQGPTSSGQTNAVARNGVHDASDLPGSVLTDEEKAAALDARWEQARRQEKAWGESVNPHRLYAHLMVSSWED